MKSPASIQSLSETLLRNRAGGSGFNFLILSTSFLILFSGASGIANAANNKNPIITSISPTIVAAGSGGLVLTVAGSGFYGRSTVLFNGSPRPTTVAGSTLLQAAVLASDLSAPGTDQIIVDNGNNGGPSNTVVLTVADPPLTIATANLPSGAVGAPYNATLAASGGTPPYAWSVIGNLPSGLSLGAYGTLRGVSASAGCYSFTIQVNDAGGQNVSKAFAVSIASLLSVVTASLPAGTVGATYSAALAASGGTPPYNWSLSSGQLPSGLSVIPSGGVSGMPTAQGAYSFALQASDSAGLSASHPYSVPVANPLSIATTNVPDGTVGSAYSDALSASGGTPPYTWSLASGSLPGGLSLNPSGTISGTPTTSGSSSFTPQVTDSAVQLASTALTMAVNASSGSVSLDQYGGVTQKPCPGGATGDWYTAQIGKRWVFCDPLGNAFLARGVWGIIGDSHTDASYVPQSFNTVAASKYPDSTTQWNAELARIQSWKFNLEGPGSYKHAWDSGIATKLPTVEGLSEASTNWQHCTLHAQCKNLWNLRWPPLVPYDSSTRHNITDAYEPTWPTFAASEYNSDSNISNWASQPYLIGFFAGDTDNCSFCSAGIDFPNQTYWPHAVYIILGSAPHAWLNKWNSNALFSDQTNNTKARLSAFLTSKYSNIAGLNAAWGSSYTTFGTTGTQVTGAACATGNGGSSYSCTPHANIDRFSLRVGVAGAAVCADDGFGNLAGPADASCGSVNYSTGAISITKTVAVGVAIAVDYWHDGYGVGTGILDEWADSSPHGWIGDKYCLNNGANTGTGLCNPGSVTTAAYRADMDNFLQQYATQFFTVLHTAFVNALPSGHKNKLFFGMTNLGNVPGRAPARCPVLAGEAAVADVVQVSTNTSTAQLDFITSCIGNKPYTLWESVTANADSDWYGYSGTTTNPSNVAAQALRATQYNSDIQNLWNHCNSATGDCQWVGEIWWYFLSQSFWEHQNFGLVSWRDNAYDGHEDVTGSVSCSAPISAYTCGGEQNNYGNFLGPATVTNQWVDQQLAGQGTIAPPTDATNVTN